MATIGWDEAVPGDTESAGLGDDRIRSLKTSLRQGLGAEHTWPSAGGDSGVHLLGSARAYYGTQSMVSSSGTDGRLMQTSDTSLLFGVGSAGTVLLGAGPTALSLGSTYGQTGFPQRHYWQDEVGIGVTTSSGTALVTFPSAYSGAPYMLVTGIYSGGVSQRYVYSTQSTINSTTAIVHALDCLTGSYVSGASFFWRSTGSRVL